MTNLNSTKFKHLTLDDRIEIQQSLNQGVTFKAIATSLSHVNSVKRKSLGGKTPYEVFTFTYGAEIANLLGIIPIPADKVNQSPRLLKK